jgi:arylsulfatase A-like enzyme
MGKYFSQQHWTRTNKGQFGVAGDETPRFPELLTSAGVGTVNVNAVGWLRNEHGQVRGFVEEKRVKGNRGRYTPSKPAVNYIVRRLKKVDQRRMFLHTHLIDPHDPYDLGGSKGSPWERYLAEVRMVDRGLLRILRAIERNHLEQRTIVIVSADHGEAFGEHGARTHGTNLYDEALKVPLLIHRSGHPGRRVDELVTTMDIGPTVLEIFGQPVPRHFMGESLVPFLKGETPKMTRPILAEARLKRALVLPNGLKVIVDTRTDQVELYDLNQDPKELENLSDDAGLLREPLATLEAFFGVHAYRQGDYRPPFIR